MSINRDKLMMVLDRAHDGPVVDTYTWDTQIIPKNIRKYLKEYDLRKTCDPENPINTDDKLVDRFFEAGVELAIETGMLCLDSHRVIKYSRDELLAGLEAAPAEFTLGVGKDQAKFKHRGFEDKTPPVWVCPLSIQVNEDLFVPITEGIAKVPEVDCIEGPSLESAYGSKIRGGSPYELLAGNLQHQLTQEAIKNAGREGMGLYCTGTSPTHYGVLGSLGVNNGYDPKKDIVLILSPVEMKTSYESLHKLAQAYNCGGRTYGGSWSMIGGYAGGPEGATLSCIATTLLLYNTYQASNGASFPYDMAYMGNTGRKAQWSLGVVFQALSRNTHLCANSVLNQVSGPVTKDLLYESAVGMMNLAVSGATSCTGVRTAGGKYLNFCTPLENKFAGEVFKGAAGMSREEANKIANQILPKYEEHLKSPPMGKSFLDCYDKSSLTPSDEWLAIYKEVKDEVIGLGMPLT